MQPETDVSLASYEHPSWHQHASDIIKRHSTNPRDVRHEALHGLDLQAVRDVLELGCGFGFMAEEVARRVHAEATFVGVDACAANADPFLTHVKGTGREACFLQQHLDRILPFETASFDLVVASYSLYFFPGILPEICRVLRPEGALLAVTHSENCCHNLLTAAGFGDDSPLLQLVRRFSAENGEQQLEPWFADVETIPYHNALRFRSDELFELLDYLRFKLPLTVEPSGEQPELPDFVEPTLRAALAREAMLTVEKDDAIFRCRRPKCH
jgi:SAM-dependent methyltransferase